MNIIGTIRIPRFRKLETNRQLKLLTKLIAEEKNIAKKLDLEIKALGLKLDIANPHERLQEVIYRVVDNLVLSEDDKQIYNTFKVYPGQLLYNKIASNVSPILTKETDICKYFCTADCTCEMQVS